MYVCICNQVTDAAIEAELDSGRASNFDEIRKNLGAASKCEKCTSCAKRVIRKHQAAKFFSLPVFEDPVSGPT